MAVPIRVYSARENPGLSAAIPAMQGTLLAGRYQVAEVLGRGGMGTVYRATDLRTGGAVAVKVLRADLTDAPEYAERLRTEAAIAASITSPRVVRVTDLDKHAGVPFLVMEYVPGPTLQETLRHTGRLPIDEALSIGVEVARALAAAHACGIVHRDLTPQNIKLVDGQIKVLDFGIARAAARPGFTNPGTFLGTPDYSAPEQADGTCDARSDLYALGVILYQLVAGHRPFRGRTPLAVLREHASTPPPPLGQAVPLPVQHLIARCLAKDPVSRYQSAEELILDLDSARGAGAAPHATADASAAGTLDLPPPVVPLGYLPVPLTSFIGRETERADVHRALDRSRLVTLSGVGGCGKTRLALEVAGARASRYADGVWLVELASLTDAALLEQTLVSALRIPEQAGQPLASALIDFLRQRELLLLLDNCEHLAAACARLVETLLGQCPRLQILTTSREALGSTGETLWTVPPLGVPESSQPLTIDDLMGCDAVRLFIDRTVALRPGFLLTDTNASAVAQICRRLDGLPLAIELAAARARVFAVEEIGERLEDRFRFLTRGSRTAQPRHQTLRLLVDWSYDLLSEPERTVFNRLSVFAGGCTLDAAEVVCAGEGTRDVEILDWVTQLVDKSLIAMDEREGVARFHMLDTIRQYAWERLVETDDVSAIRRMHAAFFASLAEQAAPHLNDQAPDAALWFARLEQERDNFRAALQWSLEHDDAHAARRMGFGLSSFWLTRGYLSEGHAWLQAILADSDDAPPAERARLLQGAGRLASARGDYLGSIAQNAECLALERQVGDRKRIADALNSLGNSEMAQGHLDAARAYHEESWAIRRAMSDEHGCVASMNNLGIVVRYAGDINRSVELLEECVKMDRAFGHDPDTALVLGNLAMSVLAQGDTERPLALLTESLSVFWRIGDKWRMMSTLDKLGAVAAAQGKAERAALLLGAAEALRVARGEALAPVARPAYEALTLSVRTALGEQRSATAWTAGRAMPLAQVIEYALTGSDSINS